LFRASWKTGSPAARGQTALEYVLLIAGVIFIVIFAILVTRTLITGPANQSVAGGAGNLFGVLNTVQTRFIVGQSCSVSPSPSTLAYAGGTSNITVTYIGLSPSGGSIPVQCGNGTTVTATSCPNAPNSSMTCSQNCTYPSNGGASDVNYSVGASVAGVTCTNGTVTVQAQDTTPPTVVGGHIEIVGDTWATIYFDASEPSNMTIHFSPANSTGGNMIGHAAFHDPHPASAAHNYTGLTPSTTYSYNVTLCDMAGNCATGSQDSFTTSSNTVTIASCGNQYSSPANYLLLSNLTCPEFGVNFTAGASGSTLNCLNYWFISIPAYQNYGVYLWNVSNFLVKDCYVSGFDRGFYLNGSNNVTLLNNDAYNNTYGVYLNPTNYSNLTGNVLVGYVGSGAGVFLNASSHNVILSNVIRNFSGGRGIQMVNLTNTSILRNEIYGNNEGINVYLQNHTQIYHNHIYDGFAGVTLADFSVVGLNTTLLNNTIHGFSFDGIELRDNQTSVLDNVIWGNGDGVSLTSISTARAGPYAVTGNRVYNNSGYGIYVAGANDSYIAHNNATYNGYGVGLNGVVYPASNITVYNNTLYNNSDSGVYLINADRNNVTGNYAFNGTYGIRLQSSHYTNATNNTVINASRYGFYLLSSNYSTLLGNVVDRTRPAAALDPYGTGYYLESSWLSNLTANNATNNFYSGYYLFQANNNTFDRALGEFNQMGLYLVSSNNTLVNNSNFSNNTPLYGVSSDSASLQNILTNTLFCLSGGAYDLSILANQSFRSGGNTCGVQKCFQSGGAWMACSPNIAGASNCTMTCGLT
jgi:parallel beta-helix repeat protein